MLGRRKKVTDLFVRGTEVLLPDGSYLWLQPLNAYERDEAIQAAQVARSRLVLALKDGGEERLKLQGRIEETGREKFIAEYAQLKANQKQSDFVSELEDDPDWAERTKILLDSNLADAATAPEPAEVAYMEKLSSEWFAELESRVSHEREWIVRQLGDMSDDDLLEDYLEYWLDVRGGVVAQAEYSLTELWRGTRLCDANGDKADGFDHAACAGHQELLFADRLDARSAPDELLELLREGFRTLLMNTRDPKDSASRSNSSASSPQPSAPAEADPSSSTATPETHPGISMLQ